MDARSFGLFALVRRGRFTPSRAQQLFALGVVVCLLVYGLNVIFGTVDASGAWGLTYGITATLVMLGVALYSVRRRTMKRPMGRSRSWQQFHVYGGILSFLLVLMHAGFRWPGAPMTAGLMVLSAWVSISGALGWLLQVWMPRVITGGLRTEAVYERIPELIEDLRKNAEALVAECPDVVRDFYARNIASSMKGLKPRAAYFIEPTAGIETRIGEFDFVREFLGPEDKDRLRRLEAVYRTKLELDAHYTLQGSLRLWLYGHVPPSIALLVLIAVHIFNVWYF